METALEHILTSAYKDEMIAYMHNHPEDFNEAIELAILDKQPYSWRAAWLLWSCMDENDTRLQGSIKKIMNVLTLKKDGHQRELIKILSMMDINEEYEGLLFTICVSLWEKTNKTPSVRYTAFKVILKIAQKHPDLKHEIDFLMQDQYMDSLSPGVKKSIARMMMEAK